MSEVTDEMTQHVKDLENKVLSGQTISFLILNSFPQTIPKNNFIFVFKFFSAKQTPKIVLIMRDLALAQKEPGGFWKEKKKKKKKSSNKTTGSLSVLADRTQSLFRILEKV
jgi:hypothetical protein